MPSSVSVTRGRDPPAQYRGLSGFANAFDSYADALLALNDSTAAAEAYRRVLAC
ncbi:MAG TPA: hypothetical protein VFM14_19360 [Gemmatimonadales bacterium]|nr:hypothetical protein [Gemmatimonadales bacterium]